MRTGTEAPSGESLAGLKLIRRGDPRGSPVFVTHGWGADSSLTMPIADLFPELDLRFLDFPGYGVNRDQAGRFSVYSESFIDEFLACLPRSCDLLAWSLSSLFAFVLCQKDRTRKIKHLITICGTPRFPADPNWPGFSSRYVVQTKRVFRQSNASRLLKLFYMLQAQNPLNSPELKAFIRESTRIMPQPDFHTLQIGLEKMADFDARNLCEAMTIPCLHLYGALDQLVPAAQAEFVCRKPGHFRYIFQHSGHMPFLTEGDAFAHIVRRFLERGFI